MIHQEFRHSVRFLSSHRRALVTYADDVPWYEDRLAYELGVWDAERNAEYMDLGVSAAVQDSYLFGYEYGELLRKERHD